ncbi:MAG: hypothetical protein U5R31_14675 [Acidimicrobiia bacterium]|nr:hypothetical protein [Acidimicrobiia bacterium]
MGLLLGDERRVDRRYEDLLLGFGFYPDDRTILDGVRTLPADSTVALADHSVAAAAPSSAPPAVPGGRRAATEELYQRFMSAWRSRWAADRHHAVLLGGFDSALVTAGLRRLGHTVETYTFRFPDPRLRPAQCRDRPDRDGATPTGCPSRRRSSGPPCGSSVRSSGSLRRNGRYPTPHHPRLRGHPRRGVVACSRVMAATACSSAIRPSAVGPRSSDAWVVFRGTRARRAGLRALSAAPVERRLGHVARVARSSLERTLLPEPAHGHLPTRYLDDAALARLRRGSPPPQDESVEEVRLRLAAPHADLDPVRLAFHGNGLTGQSRTKVEGAVASTGVAQFTPYAHPLVKDYVGALPASFLRSPGSAAGAHGKELLVEMIRER